MENMVKLIPKALEKWISVWDEGGKTEIVQILISHGESGIHSIQFAYAEEEKVRPSQVHGEPGGLKFDIVTFDYPGEYLVSVTGDAQYNALASIAFGTNKRKYGPFGCVNDHDCEGDTYTFEYNFGPKSTFGGFHGGVYNGKVYAIGVYVRPLGLLAEIEKGVDCVESEDDQSTPVKISGKKVASKRMRGGL